MQKSNTCYEIRGESSKSRIEIGVVVFRVHFEGYLQKSEDLASSAIIWIVAPVLFTPFPSMPLLKQDLKLFWDFIMAPVRADAAWDREESYLGLRF